jgi:hypothetical protein
VRVSIASPYVRPSPNDRRVGIRIRTFEACSGFTFVTAHRIAQQPKAAFVAGLRPSQLPGRAACQLPDQSIAPSGRTVNLVILTVRWSLPVLRYKRTFSVSVGMSQRCHNRTLAGGAYRWPYCATKAYRIAGCCVQTH